MRGIPQLNFAAFKEAAELIRSHGHEVFNPAEKDEATYGTGFADKAPTGDLEEVPEFSLRDALRQDLSSICQHADALALLPGWENSKGVRAELATANALGLQVTYL